MKSQTISAALLAYLVLTLSLPLLRHRALQGEWPVTFQRDADPFQRLMGALLALLLLAGLAWALLVGSFPRESLGIVQAPGWTEWLGWLLIAAGAALEVAGQLSMGRSFRVGLDDRPTALVTSGVFRLVRNPVFAGLLVALSGFVLLAPSPWSLMGVLWIASLLAIQIRLEEAHLLRLHGDEYASYASRVGRFLPGIGKSVWLKEAEPEEEACGSTASSSP
jgi:protein-S-isoprenylcysteine O-methyltransferase Ste14